MKTEEPVAETRKDYFPPSIVHTEKIETRAVTCSRSDDTACAAGPIQS